MVRDARERRDATIAWIVVGATQAAIGIWIAQLRPPVAPGAHDDALVVEVIRAPRVAGRVTRPRSSRATTIAREATRTVDPLPRAAGEAPVQSSGTAVHDVVVAPLDLRLPDMAASTAQARNPLERAPAVEARPTRFAQAWVPEGDALRQASFRSAAVGVAAAAFGGPPRRCTEVERRLRKANCLPLHGVEADDEVLRRSLDP